MKLIKIKELGIEVQDGYDQRNIKLQDIKIPKGMRLLTLSELLHIYNKYQKKFKNLEIIDEAIQNPIDKYREERPAWTLWFYGLDGRSGLGGYDRLYYILSVRGVRFCKEIK